MPSFGRKSREALDTCDCRLVKVAETAIGLMDFSILEGHRDEQTQNRYFDEGESKLRWPDGNHNKLPSLAFDIAPYPLDWSARTKAIARFYLLAGVILAVAFMLGIKLRWGGDWNGGHHMAWNA